jgi:hypothetical protein
MNDQDLVLQSLTDEQLVDRMLNVFDDTPEIASWFEQDDNEYDYTMAETHCHLLAMWETMQEAAHRIKALSAQIKAQGDVA